MLKLSVFENSSERRMMTMGDKKKKEKKKNKKDKKDGK